MLFATHFEAAPLKHGPVEHGADLLKCGRITQASAAIQADSSPQTRHLAAAATPSSSQARPFQASSCRKHVRNLPFKKNLFPDRNIH
ncbi:hypothetical protein [Leisingera sp. ANG-M7]|uniref:hypothetical protein n=1 Tax=Leisingera sp. ANG-M7 TaxID=1577902 RepID=UPI00126A4D69|nr:hypothetical protein [Leisingera sp. ANG-M7]